MAIGLLPLLQSIRQKAELIREQNKNLLLTVDSLQQENAGLRAELAQTRADLAKAQSDVEFLTVSHRLADNPDTIVSTRRRIARLIRNIDKCIVMLKEDQ